MKVTLQGPQKEYFGVVCPMVKNGLCAKWVGLVVVALLAISCAPNGPCALDEDCGQGFQCVTNHSLFFPESFCAPTCSESEVPGNGRVCAPCLGEEVCGANESRDFKTCSCVCDEDHRRFEGECIPTGGCLDTTCPLDGAECIEDMSTRVGYRCVCPEGTTAGETDCKRSDCDLLNCPEFAQCSMEMGEPTCVCDGDLGLSNDESSCRCPDESRRFSENSTECVVCDELNCGENAICDPGLIQCVCEDGFQGDPMLGCEPVDICDGVDCRRFATCSSADGTCVCDPEYILSDGDCIPKGPLMFLPNSGSQWEAVPLVDPDDFAPQKAVASMFAQPSEEVAYFVTISDVHRLNVEQRVWTASIPITDFFPGLVAPAYGIGTVAAYRNADKPGAVTLRTAAWVAATLETAAAFETYFDDFKSGESGRQTNLLLQSSCDIDSPWSCPGSFPIDRIGQQLASWMDTSPDRWGIDRTFAPTQNLAACVIAFDNMTPVQRAIAHLGRLGDGSTWVYLREDAPTCTAPLAKIEYSEFAPFSLVGAPPASRVRAAMLFRETLQEASSGFYVWAPEP